jgi:1,4-dihydroxy-2-naphthoyl-CoA synthase
MTHAIGPVDFDNLKTMTYEVTGRVARITFNRPEKGKPISIPVSTSSWCQAGVKASVRVSIGVPTPTGRCRPAG